MKSFLLFLFLWSGFYATAFSQDKTAPLFWDFGLGGGDGYTLSSSVYTMKSVLPNKQLHIGLGLRLSGFLAEGLHYTSAPPRLADNSALTDTLRIQHSRVGALNLAFFAKYSFLPKWSAGFNLDLAGIGFGTNSNATFFSENRGGISEKQTAGPTPLNILLVDVRDQGQLKSEFFLEYRWSDSWLIRGGFDMTFTEFTSTRQLTQNNARFRYISKMAFMGVSYVL